MKVDWKEIERYLAVPGTNDSLTYLDNCFRSENGNVRFPVRGHVVDFLGDVWGEKGTSTSQLEYWESSEPGLRPHEHPVQIQFAEQRFEYLCRLINFEKVQIALDVGCGNGVGTVSLSRRVGMVFGLDMSAYLLSQLPDNIVGLRGDASRLPLHDKAVDLSMAWELVHHIEDPVPVFTEIGRVTKRWVVLFEPNRWNPLQAGFSFVVSQERLGLRNTRSFLADMLEKAGMKIVHYATVGCIFPNKSPVWLAKILKKFPFKIPYLGISHLFIAEVR